jgi:twinkle protein
MQDKGDFWTDVDLAPDKPDWIYAWFAERKIGARVVDESAGVSARWTFEPDRGDVDAIALPITSKGKTVNRVLLSRKGEFSALDKPKMSGVFCSDALDAHGEPVVWCGNVLDVIALSECGINHGICVTSLTALSAHSEQIAVGGKVILAFGDDDASMAQREELARRLGRHRCWLVKLPKGRTGPFDTLAVDGAEALVDAIQAVTPYPIEGVHRIRKGTLAVLRTLPPPGVMSTGTSASDQVLRLPMEGRLIVVTGWPGHGKTNWTRYVMVHTAGTHNRRWCVFSPESQPWEQFAAECAEAYIGKPFYQMERVPSMTESDIAEAEAFLADKVTMLVCDAEDAAPNLDWLLERARACVMRDGTTDFLLDPWNEVDQDRKGLSETDFIGLCLQRLKAFALRHGCNVWIIAHPAKPAPLRPNEKRGAPGPYDLAGSANWVNRSDLGLTIHSPDPGVAQLHLWKSRARRWGSRATLATMEFDKLTGRYSTPISSNDAAAEMGDDLLRGNWR